MESTKKPTKQKKQENKTDVWVSDVLWAFQKELWYLESRLESEPEATQERLEELSKLYLEFIGSNRFWTAYTLGMNKFLKRAKRRATRKPVTLRRLNGLQEDLSNLRKILRIED